MLSEFWFWVYFIFFFFLVLLLIFFGTECYTSNVLTFYCYHSNHFQLLWDEGIFNLFLNSVCQIIKNKTKHEYLHESECTEVILEINVKYVPWAG